MSDVAIAEAPVVSIPVSIVVEASPRQLGVSRLKQADMARNTWRAIVEAGTTVADVQRPEFFAHHRVFTQYDRIEVLSEDGAFFADLLVLSVDRPAIGPATIRTKVLNQWDLGGEETGVATDASQYEIKWTGPHGKFAVIRLTDQAKVFERGQSKEEAQRWLKQHLRAFTV